MRNNLKATRKTPMPFESTVLAGSIARGSKLKILTQASKMRTGGEG